MVSQISILHCILLRCYIDHKIHASLLLTAGWISHRCKCGRCNAELLQNPNEFMCCFEIEECVESLSSEIVLQEVGTKPNCVTKHPGFSQVCLQRWSLRLAADKYKTKDKAKYRQTGSENRYKMLSAFVIFRLPL